MYWKQVQSKQHDEVCHVTETILERNFFHSPSISFFLSLKVHLPSFSSFHLPANLFLILSPSPNPGSLYLEKIMTRSGQMHDGDLQGLSGRHFIGPMCTPFPFSTSWQPPISLLFLIYSTHLLTRLPGFGLSYPISSAVFINL